MLLIANKYLFKFKKNFYLRLSKVNSQFGDEIDKFGDNPVLLVKLQAGDGIGKTLDEVINRCPFGVFYELGSGI